MRTAAPRRVEVQTGLGDGKWMEVTNRLLTSSAKGKEGWVPFDGTEKVLLLSDLTLLVDGGPVELAAAKNEPKVASEAADHRPTNPETGVRKAPRFVVASRKGKKRWRVAVRTTQRIRATHRCVSTCPCARRGSPDPAAGQTHHRVAIAQSLFRKPA